MRITQSVPRLVRVIGWTGVCAALSCTSHSDGGTTSPSPMAAPTNLSYSTNPAVYTTGSPIPANTPSSSGGAVASYSVAPALPAGLSLSSATGVITGTPTAAKAAATYVVTATNGGGRTTVNLTITVNAPPPLAPPANLSYSSNPAIYTTGSAITANTPSSSGGAVASYTVTPALPTGLSLNGASGTITGTPTVVVAATTYVITATNSAGSATVNLTITVNAPRLRVASFSVSADIAVTYPNTLGDPNRLLDLADEHSTFIPLGTGPNAYMVFAASKVASGPTGGAVVLQTNDLVTFDFATSLGYNRQVFRSPVPIDGCDPAYATEYDENYAAPGSVVQDPTLPAGNLIMLYEAENHCPGGVNQHSFYATVGFARSSDNGMTWPPFENSVLGGPLRHPVLKSVNAQPAAGGYSAMGDAIPSAVVARNAAGDYYLYVIYGFNDGGFAPANDGLTRMARAKLGADPLNFQKWYNGSFNQPGIGGLDSGVLPSAGCAPNGRQHMAEVTYNDDLSQYLFLYVCESGTQGARVGAWYYSTATSLDLQDWTTPQMVQNSQFPLTAPCTGLTTGGEFDGYYPSMMSPGAAAGHTKSTGRVFFINGCDTGKRTFTSRTFTITIAP